METEKYITPKPDVSPKSSEQSRHLARLRKACDSCSARKVKCDEKGPPCQACLDLDIPCTFDRPSRRRGPPNRYAESVRRRKRVRQEEEDQRPSLHTPQSGSVGQSIYDNEFPGLKLSIESILPFTTVCLLIDDYFTYIHPLVPVPHEPSFRDALYRREDLANPGFLALVAAMLATLVTSFPRKPRERLKKVGGVKLFPNSWSLIDRCHSVCIEARGTGYLDKDPDMYDPAISYLLGLSAAYTYSFRRCRLYFAECVALLRLSNTSNLETGNRSPTSTDRAASAAPDMDSQYSERLGEVDCIAQEVFRRLFWLMISGSRTMHQLGTPAAELLILPATPPYQYAPLPAEVDDEYITSTSIGPQPSHKLSKLTGFNINVHIFISYDALIMNDIVHGPTRLCNWENQSRILLKCLQEVKEIVDKMPRQLTLFPESSPDFQSEPTKADIAYEIQKGNIYGTHIGTRSYLVERYWSMHENWVREGSHTPFPMRSPSFQQTNSPRQTTNQDMSSIYIGDADMNTERDNIIKDLLLALRSIKQIHLEPNGSSLIYKIRFIASTLLNIPKTSKSDVARYAEHYLAQFVTVLMKLERLQGGGNSNTAADGTQSRHQRTVSSASSAVDGAAQVKTEQDGGENADGQRGEEEEDEDAELQHWADLREHQMRFVRSGGLLAGLNS